MATVTIKVIDKDGTDVDQTVQSDPPMSDHPVQGQKDTPAQDAARFVTFLFRSGRKGQMGPIKGWLGIDPSMEPDREARAEVTITLEDTGRNDYHVKFESNPPLFQGEPWIDGIPENPQSVWLQTPSVAQMVGSALAKMILKNAAMLKSGEATASPPQPTQDPQE